MQDDLDSTAALARPRELPGLPAGYSPRTPTPEDASLVLEVVATCERHELGEAQIELEDILGDWRQPDVDVAADGIFIVDGAGAPVGHAELTRSRAEGNVLPEHRGRGLGSWLAAWIERRAHAAGADFVRQVVPASAVDRIELLERAGYDRSDTAWELELPLARAGRRPALPPGVHVRDFRAGLDDAAVFRLIEDAFGHWPNRSPNTLEGWRATTVTRGGFEPWMLPLLWRGDQLVGAACCIDHPEDASVWIQQVAVRADERGRGLGTQLLHEAFERFGDRGRVTARLSTDSRTGALPLYERVGMRIVREFVGFSLPVARRAVES